MQYTTPVQSKVKREGKNSMEWMNRGGEPQQAANTPAQTGTTRTKRGRGGNNLRIMSVVLLFAVTIVLVGVVGLLTLGGGGSKEGGFVDDDRLQAVFLAGGQVYFGDITQLNDEYVEMKNIYYLRVNQTVQPDQEGNNQQQATQNDISLVKLGCELHGPQDQMLINRDQVIFWENLKDDGQVANAVKDYVAANPNGQDCSAQQGQSTNPAGGTQPAEGE